MSPLIGAGERWREIGNIVSHVSVEAISVVAARAHAHWLRRIRTVRTDGRPAPTAGALAGAYGQAASHPRIGGRAAPFPVPFEGASLGIRQSTLQGLRPAPEAAQAVRLRWPCPATVHGHRATKLIVARRTVKARVRALAALNQQMLAPGSAGRLSEKGRAARYPTRKSTRRALELRSPWARMSTAAAQRGSSLRYGHLRRRPFDHLDMPTVTALEELNRWQAGAKP